MSPKSRQWPHWTAAGPAMVSPGELNRSPICSAEPTVAGLTRIVLALRAVYHCLATHAALTCATGRIADGWLPGVEITGVRLSGLTADPRPRRGGPRRHPSGSASSPTSRSGRDYTGEHVTSRWLAVCRIRHTEQAEEAVVHGVGGVFDGHPPGFHLVLGGAAGLDCVQMTSHRRPVMGRITYYRATRPQ